MTHLKLLALLPVIGVATACVPAPSRLDVQNPCGVFVSDSTPVLRRGKNGLELAALLAPATTKEATAILSAVSRGPIDLDIYPREESFRAIRLEDGQLVFQVASTDHADSLAYKLCLRVPDYRLTRPNNSFKPKPLRGSA
jgi:hypothetical protein